ncbi:hypothetical protein [Blautia sp.]|uniref:hypothetical protein n=1 Tax=Blautia sp. TaxID=1955243 RepID=UPI002E777D82|nr:hypothetical protein [Blautia sp.]MEE0809717.1 hypothetical protein [Blautia sp.]
MENELTFRTSVGGYRKDEVMEYVENLNDEMFHMKKTYEDEIGRLRVKVQELETLLQQSESNASRLAEEQSARIEKLEGENADLKETLDATTKELGEVKIQYQKAQTQRDKEALEKQSIKEKLAKEILRLRAENQVIRENWKDAENRAGCKEDYEAVREAVSEAQFKITEYVNIINKTQESLGETYQRMNGIKKKIAQEIEKATKK